MGLFSKLKNFFKKESKKTNEFGGYKSNQLNNDFLQTQQKTYEINSVNASEDNKQVNVASNNLNTDINLKNITNSYNPDSDETISQIYSEADEKELIYNSQLTKQNIKNIIVDSSDKFEHFVKEDIAQYILYSLGNVEKFDFDKQLKYINFLLDSVIFPWNLDLDKKFKELLMIYFFERSLIEKKIKEIIVPIFNNINIDWSKDWKQANNNMSVCFDFTHKFGNNFKLCTAKDCDDYCLNKIKGTILNVKENFNYLVARATMTDNLYEILKENPDNKYLENNSKIIGLLGEYYIANKLLYGKSTSNLTSSKDLSKGESYEPDNLEYIERICDGFNRNKYILRKMYEKNHQNFSNHISDVFKVFWSRIQDEYSENDFVIKYPYFPNDTNSISSKGTYSKLIEVKSTRRFYEYLPEVYFNQWVNENHNEKNKYWKDHFKLTIKEFYNLKKNQDYVLLRVYGIDYDFSDLKSKVINNENDLEGLFIKHTTMNDNFHRNDNQRVVVVKMDRYYLLKQILAFFNNYDLLCREISYLNV